MSIGKQFEGQVKRGFENAYPEAWIERFTDAVFGNGRMSAPSPPDLLIVASDFTALVECKAVKGPSIPFDRLADHQREHLLAFDDVREDAFGIVAVLRYNGVRGRDRIYEGWLIPIKEWVLLTGDLGRKSLPLTGEIRRYLAPYYMAWVPSEGGWQIGPVISRGVSDAARKVYELPNEEDYET